MKCKRCGYISFDYLDNCKKCSAPLHPKEIYKFLYKNKVSDDLNLDQSIGFQSYKNFPEFYETESLELANSSTKNKLTIRDLIIAPIVSRFLAFLIDILVLILISLFTVVFGIKIANLELNIKVDNLFQILSWGYLFLFVLAPSYFVIFLTYSGQTVGKMILRIKVVNKEGEKISFSGSFIRCLGYYLSILPFFAGLILIIFDIKNQSLHDKLAKTYVVRV